LRSESLQNGSFRKANVKIGFLLSGNYNQL
jgi:hypothetical protein